MTTGISVHALLKKFGAVNKGQRRACVFCSGNMGMIAIRIATVMGNKVSAMHVHESKKSLALELGTEFFMSWAKAEVSLRCDM